MNIINSDDLTFEGNDTTNPLDEKLCIPAVTGEALDRYKYQPRQSLLLVTGTPPPPTRQPSRQTPPLPPPTRPPSQESTSKVPEVCIDDWDWYPYRIYLTQLKQLLIQDKRKLGTVADFITNGCKSLGGPLSIAPSRSITDGTPNESDDGYWEGICFTGLEWFPYKHELMNLKRFLQEQPGQRRIQSINEFLLNGCPPLPQPRPTLPHVPTFTNPSTTTEYTSNCYKEKCYTHPFFCRDELYIVHNRPCPPR